MKQAIDSFSGQYHFLSNFHHAPVTVEGVSYLNTEAAFQAFKLADVSKRHVFSKLEPSAAKRKGRQVKLRSDWEQVKDELMFEVIKVKFTYHADLRSKLLATGDVDLIEGNDWRDDYWGVVNGVGQNRLGQLLMRLRADLRASLGV
jgi:hypothetical protein